MPVLPGPPDSPWRRVGIVAAVLLVGSLLPLPLRRRPAFGRFGPDKFLHFVGYGALTVLMAGALRSRVPDRRVAGCLAIGIATAYGLGIGRLQERVPGRAHESADIWAGVLGGVVGMFGWNYLQSSSGHTEPVGVEQPPSPSDGTCSEPSAHPEQGR